MRWRFHSDAALLGTGKPSICGNLYRRAYSFAITESFQRWPIIALECAGEGPLNLLTFGEDLAEVAGYIVLPCDSLVAPRVMTSGARRSPLLRYMHRKFIELPIFKKLEKKLVCSHEYGVGNKLTDSVSRGQMGVAREVARSMGFELEMTQLPKAAIEYMMDVDRHLDELLRLGEYSLNAAAADGKHARGATVLTRKAAKAARPQPCSYGG